MDDLIKEKYNRVASLQEGVGRRSHEGLHKVGSSIFAQIRTVTYAYVKIHWVPAPVALKYM